MAISNRVGNVSSSPEGVFVYGTLQQGEQREQNWPRTPRSRQCATVRGTLFDLGAYPALLPGKDLIGGEFWEIAAADMPVTLQVLDGIEGYNQGHENLYERRVIFCRLETGITVSAYTYFWAQANATHLLEKMTAGPDGVHLWRRGPGSHPTP